MKTLRALWMRFTFHSGDPQDDIPWYAPILTTLFLFGVYALIQTLDKAGF